MSFVSVLQWCLHRATLIYGTAPKGQLVSLTWASDRLNGVLIQPGRGQWIWFAYTFQVFPTPRSFQPKDLCRNHRLHQNEVRPCSTVQFYSVDFPFLSWWYNCSLNMLTMQRRVFLFCLFVLLHQEMMSSKRLTSFLLCVINLWNSTMLMCASERARVKSGWDL